MWRGKHRGTPGGVLSHSRASTVTVPKDVIRRWIGTRTFSAVESRESYYSHILGSSSKRCVFCSRIAGSEVTSEMDGTREGLG